MLLELVDAWLGGLEGAFFPLLVKILFNPFVKGMTAILANQGVAEMLTINLIGSNAFVIAYAVANLHNHISQPSAYLPIVNRRELTQQQPSLLPHLFPTTYVV